MTSRYLPAIALLAITSLAVLPAAHAQDPFITTWQTDNPGSSDPDQITIPITGSGYNFTVDWGDGTTTTWQDGDDPADLTHTYTAPATFTVEVSGDFPAINLGNFGGPSDAEKLLTIEQWGDIAWGSMVGAFSGALNLEINATDVPDLSAVTSMRSMFFRAESMNSDLSGWDVSNVEDMSGLFNATIAFNGDITTWDVSSVTDMNGMFSDADAFNQDISGWNVSNVTDMVAMFSRSAFNQDISNWDVANVTNMSYMFYSTDFNQDIDSWDVANVTNMSYMFWEASPFDQNLGGWDIGNVTDMSEMFLNTGLSTANYDATLIGWAGQAVQSGVALRAGGLSYCAGVNARQSLINDHGWTITGDAVAFGCQTADPVDVAGWRLITVPGGGLTVQDLAGRNLVQGISDAYPGGNINLFVDYDGPTNADYTAASSTSDALEAGRGFFWYLFDDADFTGSPPPEFVDIEIFAFPGDLGTEQTTDVTVAFPAIPATDGTDLPAFMIGNPFQDPFALSGVSASNGTLQTNFHAWYPSIGSYVLLSATAPNYTSVWQGFWAEVDGASAPIEFTFDAASVDDTQDPTFYGLRSTDFPPVRAGSSTFAIDIELRGTFESGRDVADLASKIRFEPDAMLAWDRHDGSKFYPPVSMDGHALLSLEGVRQSDVYRQAVRSLPSALDEAVTIPLAFLSAEAGDFTLSAEAMNLPEGWNATLRDLETDEETNLLDASHSFIGTAGEDWQNRFELTITPAGVVGSGEDAIELRLSNPAPNPATRSTALVLRVPEAQQVTARVYDALGRHVATAHDGALAAGEESRLEIDTSVLAAGTYVVRVEGEAFAETRQFAVVR